MLKNLILLVSCVFLLLSCRPQYSDFFPYHDDGTPKPKVALLPVLDETQDENPDPFADQSDELIRDVLKQRGELYLFDKSKIEEVSDKMDEATYFGKDLSFARQFGGADYVVTLGLIEHRIIPYVKEGKSTLDNPSHNQPCQSLIAMKMRVRIVDIRSGTPKIILQEIRDFTHAIVLPKGWENSPRPQYWTLAEQKLVNDVALRLEQEIWSAR